jgi:hypothetical protein
MTNMNTPSYSLRSITASLAVGLITLMGPPVTAAAVNQYDIVIYGGGSAAVASAVQAKRMGKSVIVVSPDIHLGGLSAGGLGFTDTGNKSVIGGIAREFYHRVFSHYQEDSAWQWEARKNYGNRGQGTPAIDGDERTMWIFEPHVAEKVFEDLVRENQIPLIRDEWLNRDGGVVVKDGRIQSITTLRGNTYHGAMFIDATYEGDLMASAGVSYFVGREANSQYNETLNGVQIENARSHQFTSPIDPYIIEGDPTSGLLPKIHAGSPGLQGEADKRLQAFNYRVCLTRVLENKVPFRRPNNYDPFQYELLLRSLKAGSWHIKGKFDMIPNQKTDTNNHGSFSTDNIGMNYDYPGASYERRQAILKEHEEYQRGYFYFIANDPRVPEDKRQWMSQWGLSKDEFKDNDHWPHQIYVREARRLVSDFVITENHVTGKIPTPRSVGMGSYNMDSHNTQRYVDETGHAKNEGDVQISPGGPYPIDYGGIVPKESECQNLFVPVCLSASHIAFGSIRMEPVFMILGQSAATAACLAIDRGTSVQDVSYDELRERLLEDGQVLVKAGKQAGIISKDKLKGFVVDEVEVLDIDSWHLSSSVKPYVKLGYRHDNNQNKGKLNAKFIPKNLKNRRYEVRISYTAHGNRASNVPITINHAEGNNRLKVNQRVPGNVDKTFHSLGVYQFDADHEASVSIGNRGTDGYVIIDSVQWIPEENK